MKRTKPGKPKTFVIEVGPITFYDFSDAEIRASEFSYRRGLDAAVRAWEGVGPRSKVVKSRIEDAA